MFKHINKNVPYVQKIQEMIGTRADGVAGKNTLKKLRAYYNSEIIAHNGKFIPLNNSKDYIVEHDLSLHTLPDGEQPWYYRKNKIDCFNYL